MRRWGCIFLCLGLLWIGGLCVAAQESQIIYRYVSNSGQPRIALTFDDGPHPRYTPVILDLLAEYDIPATFFVVGSNAETYPDLVRRIYTEGHEIGNHTYHHNHVSKLNPEELSKEIALCNAAVERITNHPPKLFRPPEGVCTGALKTICGATGMTIVLWSVDTRDWAHTPVREICQNVKANTANGSIILMHDFIGKNSPTPEALRHLLPMLRELGFEFVTVTQLLEG